MGLEPQMYWSNRINSLCACVIYIFGHKLAYHFTRLCGVLHSNLVVTWFTQLKWFDVAFYLIQKEFDDITCYNATYMRQLYTKPVDERRESNTIRLSRAWLFSFKWEMKLISLVVLCVTFTVHCSATEGKRLKLLHFLTLKRFFFRFWSTLRFWTSSNVSHSQVVVFLFV